MSDASPKIATAPDHRGRSECSARNGTRSVPDQGGRHRPARRFDNRLLQRPEPEDHFVSQTSRKRLEAHFLRSEVMSGNVEIDRSLSTSTLTSWRAIAQATRPRACEMSKWRLHSRNRAASAGLPNSPVTKRHSFAELPVASLSTERSR